MRHRKAIRMLAALLAACLAFVTIAPVYVAPCEHHAPAPALIAASQHMNAHAGHAGHAGMLNMQICRRVTAPTITAIRMQADAAAWAHAARPLQLRWLNSRRQNSC